MVSCNVSSCPNCGEELKHYDTVRRLVRTKGGVTDRIKIRRLRCIGCNKLHREIPNSIFPHKHYEAEVINGVLDGFITSETIGFEDYPCEITMNRWKTQKKQ